MYGLILSNRPVMYGRKPRRVKNIGVANPATRSTILAWTLANSSLSLLDFEGLLDPYPYRACSVSCSSKYIIVIFCVIHDSCGTTAVKLRVSSSASSRTGASVICVRDSPYVHLGNTRTSPVVFSCQYFSTLHVSTLKSAQVKLMHQASVVRNDVSSARHSGVDISPPCPMCPPWAWSCLEQESRAGAMTARHENAHNGLYMLMPYPMKATDGAGMASKTSLRKVVGPMSPSLSCYFYLFISYNV